MSTTFLQRGPTSLSARRCSPQIAAAAATHPQACPNSKHLLRNLQRGAEAKWVVGGGGRGRVSIDVFVDIWVTNVSVSIFFSLSASEKNVDASAGL